jgi:hypothetical protein
VGSASVWSWARSGVSVIEELGSFASTRSSGTTRRAWWRDLGARGDGAARQFLAVVRAVDRGSARFRSATRKEMEAKRREGPGAGEIL